MHYSPKLVLDGYRRIGISTCINEIRLTLLKRAIQQKNTPNSGLCPMFYYNCYSFFFCVSLLAGCFACLHRFSLSPWPAFMAASLACAATASGRRPRMAPRRPRCGFWRPTTSTDARLGSQMSWDLFEEASRETVNNFGMIAFKKQKVQWFVVHLIHKYIREFFWRIIWFCYYFALPGNFGLKESVLLYIRFLVS